MPPEWATTVMLPPSVLAQDLKRARDADPGWHKAWQEWADGESRHGKDDPCEGKPFIEKGPNTPKP